MKKTKDVLVWETEKGVSRKLYRRGKSYTLEVFEQRPGARIDFVVNMGRAEGPEELLADIDLLAKGNRGGLANLLRYAGEADEDREEPICPDGMQGGLSGRFESELWVRNGRICYEIELCDSFAGGTAVFDLGIAYEKRVKRLRRTTREFEHNYLMCFLYNNKSRCLDGGV